MVLDYALRYILHGHKSCIRQTWYHIYFTAAFDEFLFCYWYMVDFWPFCQWYSYRILDVAVGHWYLPDAWGPNHQVSFNCSNPMPARSVDPLLTSWLPCIFFTGGITASLVGRQLAKSDAFDSFKLKAEWYIRHYCGSIPTCISIHVSTLLVLTAVS